MKRNRFSEEQIIGILKEHEAGVSVADLAASMASATPASTNGRPSSAGWSLGGQAAEDARGREHAAETACWPMPCSTTRLEGPLGKEMVTPAGKRKAVAHLRDAFGMSERRACKAIGCCRMTMRYQTTRADDAGLRQRMRAIAQERRRFGYRRLHVLLKREGYRDQPQEAVPALPGREACGAPPRRSQAGDRDQGADAGPGGRPTTAGRSTSCRTSSPTAAASAS